ncbi:DUF4190 domain-containing protein [Streptomyces sp. C11-1]|uniref:DUF4190 domain-containing protein n=1 Tax=Streptomyces durocortorensis TaxID=2811104 RepID=A0ABY9VZB0_9ACTN|nr:DUF4190 domain-containing protein [Streptomyces durocortorensis]WNF27985.1 DUF4190 domain-containing protein [Streptomyces durocortorensis]
MDAQGIGTALDHAVSAQDQAVRDRTAPNRMAPNRMAPNGMAPGLTAPRNSLATAALTLGVISLCTSVVFIGGLLSVIGLILGIAALIAAKQTGAGRRRAVAAVVTSSLAIVVSGLVAVFMVWYANKTQECYQPDSFQQYTQCVRAQLNAD